ncbi:MAG: DUF342 domain-containing protein [Nitrospirae bacterium]|nr:DUF342 domain-containing protein [Nitrospirota bacterium]
MNQAAGAPADLPYSVSLATDELEAYLSFDPKGLTPEDCASITADNLKEELKRQKVVRGILEKEMADSLARIHKGQALTNAVVAKGHLPEDGQEGRIEWQVEIHDQAAVVDEATGKVDYRQRKVIKSVSQGALLALRHGAHTGTDGHTVTGRVLKAKRAQDAQLVAGKNVEVVQRPTGEYEYHSLINGVYVILGNRIDVNESTIVAADIDFNTGNIKCNGSLKVGGRIATGFKVEVEKDLEVGDMVEAAEIVAGGNVILRSGIKGQDKGIIKCGGNFAALYAERAVLEVQGDVEIVNGLFDCRVICGGKVIAVKGKGGIIGGEIRAAKGIEAKRLGSDFSSSTVLEVGIDFLTEQALVENAAKLKALQETLGKIERVLSRDILEKGDLSFVPEPQRPQFVRILETWRAGRLTLKQLTQDKINLLEKKKNTIRATITALEQAYARVKLKIGVSTLTTDKEYNRVVFYEDVDDKKIKFSYK